MTSALKRQLAAIAANSTRELDLKAQRTAHSQSLIFEPKDASSQTFEYIFQFCSDGFRELCNLDGRFSAFTTTLFSEQSKQEERERMTEAENAQLDGIIERFLSLVQSRLLLAPSLRALEWLVRRFRIHEYNVECFLLMLLPYHETQLFTTVMSLLTKPLPPTFKFLHPYKTSLTNPPRHTIVYSMSSVPALFAAYNGYTLRTAQSHHHSAISLSFWVCVVTQTLDTMLDTTRSGRANIQQQRQEDILLRVMPFLKDALAVKDVPEMSLGCYLAIAILASKTGLRDEMLDALMESILLSIRPATTNHALACLSALARERQDSTLPSSVAKGLIKIPDLGDRFISLSGSWQIDRLAQSTILGLLKRHGEACHKYAAELTLTCVRNGLVTRAQATVITKAFLRAITHAQGKPQRFAEVQELTDGLVQLCDDPDLRELIRSLSAHQTLMIGGQNLADLLPFENGGAFTPQAPAESLDKQELDPGELAPRVDDMLSALPQQTNVESFLVEASDSSLLRNAEMAFQRMAHSGHIEKLAEAPVLRKDSALDMPLYNSFFLRHTCKPSQGIVRIRSFEMIYKTLSAIQTPSIRFQALVPYLLIGLADESQTVRRAAARIVRKLAVSDGAAEDEQNSDIWGIPSLYGPSLSEKIAWMSARRDINVLVKVVSDHLEESCLDANHITRLLHAFMDNGHASSLPETKRGALHSVRSATKEAVALFLGSHVPAVPLLWMRYRLLAFLEGVGKASTATRTSCIIPCLQNWICIPLKVARTQCQHEGIDLGDFDRQFVVNISPRESSGLLLLRSLVRGDVGQERDSMVATIANERIRHIWPLMKSGPQRELAEFLLDFCLAEAGQTESQLGHQQADAADTLRAVQLSSSILISFLESLPDTVPQMHGKAPAAKRRRTSRSEDGKVDVHDSKQIERTLRKFTLVLELVEQSSPGNHPDLLRSLFHVLNEVQHYRSQTNSGLVYLQSLILGSLKAIADSIRDEKRTQADTNSIRIDLLVDCIRTTSNLQVQNITLLLLSSFATWAPELVLHNVMPIFTYMSTTVLRQNDDYSAHVIDQTITRVIPPLSISLRKRHRNLVIGASELLLSFAAAYEHIPLPRRQGLFYKLVKTVGAEECLYAVVAMLVDRYQTDPDVRSFASGLVASFDSSAVAKTVLQFLALVEDARRPRRTIYLAKTKGDLPNQRPEGLPHGLTDILGRTVALFHSLKGEANVQRACGGVLSAVLDMLPIAELIKCSRTLLQDTDDDSLRQWFLMATSKHMQASKSLDEQTRAQVTDLLPRVTAILESSPESPEVSRAAVQCIDQVVEKIGRVAQDEVIAAAEVVSGTACFGSDNEENDHKDDLLRVAALLCLASMVEVLADQFIPLLPRTLSQAYGCLVDSIEGHDPGDRLHNAVYAFLSAVVQYLPSMISGNSLDSALGLSFLSATSKTSDNASDSRLAFYQLAYQLLNPDSIFAALERNWANAVQKGIGAATEHLLLLSNAIEKCPKSAIRRNSQHLFKFFTAAFDFRRTRSVERLNNKYDDVHVAQIEAAVNHAAIEMTMKMNDESFRPFFANLVDWAKVLPKRDSTGRALRSTSLFIFLRAFFERLRGIVTEYSSYVLELAVECLQMSPSNETFQKLHTAVLDALSKNFQYDESEFWQAPSHFDAIAKPLLDHLDNSKVWIVNKHIIPAVVNLAAAASASDNHKKMNSAILKKMRADEACTRLAAVQCEQRLTSELGEDWLSLLPEMLPFISELQEDDDENVERETHRWIKQIEDILGESLEGMLQ
ncbi:hypothetical protein BDY21DRAFT_329518 [Lineolata rhizophorae]|uniref:U3 small nucleolar RNA-associated protein 10 n=1 Tax=Lineolata rhizophorae TaxID=578093 RepID=A0A6A6PCR8_9PEZI|nr:hypothetical protein BDY21DRAFT_329518 [Lineolata rhizophorae]